VERKVHIQQNKFKNLKTPVWTNESLVSFWMIFYILHMDIPVFNVYKNDNYPHCEAGCLTVLQLLVNANTMHYTLKLDSKVAYLVVISMVS
jgi:hypothetical protein